jgi:hypothetical protein
MRVVIERSGGFAGIYRAQTLSTDDMPAEDAQKLRDLVDASGFYELPSVIHSDKPVPDAFRYKITVDSERGTHTVEVDEGAVPPRLQPILNWVKRPPSS